MTEQSSPTSPTPSAFYDPESSSWRMCQASLLSEVPESLERLPAWGTTSDGVLYELRTPERLIGVRDGSASPGLPTPQAWDSARGPDLARANRPDSGGIDLVTVTERLLPTPTTVDSHSTGRTTERLVNGDTKDLALREAVKLLPTPAAWDGNRGPDNSRLQGDGKRPSGQQGTLNLAGAIQLLTGGSTTSPAQAAKHGSTPDIHANGFGSNLWDIPHLLPTPTGRDHKGRNQRNDETCLPGAVLALPSLDGSESSTGQHPHPPTTGNSPAGSSNG